MMIAALARIVKREQFPHCFDKQGVSMYTGCCIGMFTIKEALPVMMKTLIRVLVVLALLVLMLLLVQVL